jgi:PAS domain S-box-containing protein
MKNIRIQQRFTLSFCFICRLHLFLLAFASFFLLHSLTYGAESKQEKRVLILFTNRSDLPAYPVVEKGIKSSLKAGTEFHIEYFIEYMDYYRNPEPTYIQSLLDSYHRKFSNHKLDLVIPFSAPALSLVIGHHNDLFPQTPVVFSGIPRVQLTGLTLSSLVTGVLLDIDYAGLLETALRIHPQTRHVAVVNGASVTGLLYEKEFRKALEPYARRLDFIYLTRLPMGEVVEKIRNLPEHSVVLYYVLGQDGEGKSFIPQEVASILSEAANAPVYGCLDTYLGHGIVGGRLTSLEMIGIKAGETALRILRGEKPSDIPMSGQGTIMNMFDWRQFKRFKIREDRLPPGSIVRFKTYSFWELYRGYIVAALFLILLQSGLISFLLWQRAQRRRAEEKYRTVADFTYDWEYWANLDDSLEYVSPSCEHISGYQIQDFIDNPPLFKEIIVPEDRDIWDRHYHDSRQELKAREIQFRIQRPDGQIRWIEHNCQPVINRQGSLQGFRASNRDISERKKAEFEVQQQRNELAHVTRAAALGELTSSIAHELNQPLAAIRNYANAAQRFLSQSEPDLSKARDALEGIARDDRRAAEVISRIRELLRKDEPHYHPVQVNQVIQEVLAFIRSDAVIEGLTIETGLAPALPVVMGDRVQLQQVLLNLILNAVEAMNKVEPDQRKLVIKTENKEDRGVQVSVRDLGAGIDEAHRAKLFESFFSTKAKGMGMGLAISQRIIHAHGGTIWGENNPDGGATFGFTLPTGNNGQQGDQQTVTDD